MIFKKLNFFMVNIDKTQKFIKMYDEYREPKIRTTVTFQFAKAEIDINIKIKKYDLDYTKFMEILNKVSKKVKHQWYKIFIDSIEIDETNFDQMKSALYRQNLMEGWKRCGLVYIDSTKNKGLLMKITYYDVVKQINLYTDEITYNQFVNNLSVMSRKLGWKWSNCNFNGMPLDENTFETAKNMNNWNVVIWADW